MNNKQVCITALDDSCGGGSGPVANTEDHRLPLTVIYTSSTAALAALKAGGRLAKDLPTRVHFVVPIVVSWRVPLDLPQVSIDSLEKRLIALVAKSRIDVEEIFIDIRLCRDRRDCLRKVMGRHSLVVMGGKNHWWFGEERRLGKFLRKLGHQVILVNDAEAINYPSQLPSTSC
jgi:hypothetical protein